MTLQPGQQTNAMHILPNTSKSKGNRAIKFGHLIECNVRNILLEKSCIKMPIAFILYDFFLMFCMIFEKKYVTFYTLLTDQISLTGCLYVVRY